MENTNEIDELNESNMLVIGITGGIGSGKSTVAELIKNYGYIVISTDDMAKEIMANNKIVKEKLIEQFGNVIYFDDGTLNKTALTDLVFGDGKNSTDNLQELNQIVHPAVIDEMINQTQVFEQSGEKIIFIESALIFEAELDEGFDFIVVVDCPEDISIQRIQAKTDWTVEQIKRRMNEQMPRMEKSRNADFVIDNKFSIDELKTAVDFVVGVISKLIS